MSGQNRDNQLSEAILSQRGWLSEQQPEIRQLILEESTTVRFAKGATIYQSGDPGDGIYGVVLGRIKFSSFQDDGREIISGVASPGTWFGELSVMDGLPRHHSAITLSDVLVLYLSLQKFRKLVTQTPAYLSCFMAILSRNLRSMITLQDILSKPPLPRLMELIAMLRREYIKSGQRPEMRIKVSQDQLAGMSGLTRQTINSTLRTLEEKGLIERRYGEIVVKRAEEVGN